MIDAKSEYKQVYDNFVSMILYQKIVSWNSQELKLENGITLVFEEDQDCCASADGEWEFVKLDAMITDIKIDVKNQEKNDDDDDDMVTNHATITIFHNNNPIAKAECSANDGNGGYYYSILTLKIKETDDAICVVSA